MVRIREDQIVERLIFRHYISITRLGLMDRKTASEFDDTDFL